MKTPTLDTVIDRLKKDRRNAMAAHRREKRTYGSTYYARDTVIELTTTLDLIDRAIHRLKEQNKKPQKAQPENKESKPKTPKQYLTLLSESQTQVMGWLGLPSFSSKVEPNGGRFIIANGNNTSCQWFRSGDMPPQELIYLKPDEKTPFASIYPTELGKKVIKELKKQGII